MTKRRPSEQLLTKGLQDPEFLLKFGSETDPWTRSKMVGQKIGEILKTFATMTMSEKNFLDKERWN
jgi:hypothetical protein